MANQLKSLFFTEMSLQTMRSRPQ